MPFQGDRPRQHNEVVEQYAELACDYDRRWASYIEATTRATIARLRAAAHDVLDVGCGTGAVLTRLLGESPSLNLAGIDPSAEMLQIARAKLPNHVALQQGWAEELPFDEGCFDAVLSCSAFHFIRDPKTAVGEMLRVLRPGGQLVITDWCHDYLTCKLCHVYLQWNDPAHERMYGTRDLREILHSAGAREVIVDRYKATWLWGMMTATAEKSVSAIRGAG